MRLFFMGPRLWGGIHPGVSFGAEDLRWLRQPNTSPNVLGGSFVYVIKGEHNRCKIGISSNPTARITQLRTASPFPLSFAFLGATSGNDGSAIEREAHALIDRYRKSGEWFDCPVELAVAAVNASAAKLGQSLNSVDPAIVDQIIAAATGKNSEWPLWPTMVVAAFALMIVVWILGHIMGGYLAPAIGVSIAYAIVLIGLITRRPFFVMAVSAFGAIAIAIAVIAGLIVRVG